MATGTNWIRTYHFPTYVVEVPRLTILLRRMLVGAYVFHHDITKTLTIALTARKRGRHRDFAPFGRLRCESEVLGPRTLRYV